MSNTKMICPFCLTEGTFKNMHSFYQCPQCSQEIPVIWVHKYDKNKKRALSAVGFSGHGKTVYFASLFFILDRLPNIWPKFFTVSLDMNSLETVRRNKQLLKEGTLPPATMQSFPIPTIVQFSNIPSLVPIPLIKNDYLCVFYDTGGENFENPRYIIENAHYIKNSRSVLFFVDLENPELSGKIGDRLHELIQIYINGITRINPGISNEQDLIVVLTKGDLLHQKLVNYPEIWKYMIDGNVDDFKGRQMFGYFAGMKRISKQIRKFLMTDINAALFVHTAEDHFSNVRYCIISSLGAHPTESVVPFINPKRVIDPFLWAIFSNENSKKF